ncbi:unnamed protein product [Plutella xylostella]|uniref:(diamondback moth) hypothetical protein n=1 Tax=Plutella xylostella TaxID=51655 RepID=A0A8S4DBI4_PLUXY|nr:unnamed protein product [Plutella xylostella]
MKTIVVPVVKNRTGDLSDSNNYRPISLATVIAKVLDSLLNKHLDKCLRLHSGQFGFRAGLSTESAIMCLKQTVQYYTSRKTPVYACFLDLSKAFDRVSFDILWDKLAKEMPQELVSVFRYWYDNQVNTVRWSNSSSGEYRLGCGVRQGGLSSPKLFNLYMNDLIGELSSTKVGCSIDGVMINNISYADDMVLLSPSINGLTRLLAVCESYAETHGLRYNTKKSELLVFQAPNIKKRLVPSVYLGGVELNRVTEFKYLGHVVTETLVDDLDMERERRALAIRCNMLARRFARCTRQVKLTLFRAYCQSFYTCSLWVNYTRRAYSALRVQYNNALRIVLGLPRFCSASGMFAEARVDDFFAVMRKRAASLLSRTRSSSNAILSVWADRMDSPIVRHCGCSRDLLQTAAARAFPSLLNLSSSSSYSASPSLEGCSRDWLQTAAARARCVLLPAGELLQHAADIGRDIYVLQKGHCNILNHTGKIVSSAGPGANFGVMEMLYGLPKVYTVVTTTACSLLHLEYSALVQCLSIFPDVMEPIAAVIEDVDLERMASKFVEAKPLSGRLDAKVNRIATQKHQFPQNPSTDWVDIVLYCDMVLMSYVGYYDARSLLITHPLLTISHYLKHAFWLDLVTVFPVEEVVSVFILTL